MKRACVAIVDAARARLFTYSVTDEDGPLLHDEKELTSPGRDDAKHGMFTDHASMKPGVVGPGGMPGNAHRGGHGSVDDHRGGHVAELDTRFAKEIIAQIGECMKANDLPHLVLVASPKMLGILRGETSVLTRSGRATITEVDQNLGNLSLAQIQDQLSRLDLIGPRLRQPTPRASGAGIR